MKGVIVNFRRGKRTQSSAHMIILPESKDSTSLIGKTVVWKSPAGREIRGMVAALHGRKGAVRVIFERGMPGQAVSQNIEILA